MSKRFLAQSLFAIPLLILGTHNIKAQNFDCDKAIVICSDDTFLNFNSRSGGADDFANPNNSAGCFDFIDRENGNIRFPFREERSGWFYLEFRDDMPANSVLEFSIEPILIDSRDNSDYDFALYGPDLSCDSLGAPIRCSFINGGCEFCPNTGLGRMEVDTSESQWDAGLNIPNQNGYVAPLVVQPGEAYLLMLEYFEGDAPVDLSNINIDWGGSAAPFLNCVANPFCEDAEVVAAGDTTVCQGNTIPLFSTATNTNGGESYFWSGTNGATSWIENPNSPNTNVNIPADFPGGRVVFTILVEEGNCRKLDSVIVNVNPLPQVSLDGIIVGCTGDINTITATPGFDSYIWNTGATSNSIQVGQTGLYSVTVTNVEGCSVVEEFFTQFVEFPDPLINGDTIFCFGGSTTLDAGAGLSTYLWSDGSSDRFLEVTEPGLYFVDVMTDVGMCNARDSIVIVQYPRSFVEIQGDDLLCPDELIDLSVPDIFESYTWSNGSTQEQTTISVAQSYSITVVDDNGCEVSDTFDVQALPAPLTGLPPDTLFCINDSLFLEATPGLTSYQWTTGSVDQGIWINMAGEYTVTVTDDQGCRAEGTTTVRNFEVPPTTLEDIYEICAGDAIEISPGNTFSSYSWSTGESTPSITVNQEGTYTVTIVDGNGCQLFDTAQVIVNELPLPDISGDTTICGGEPAVLVGESGFVSYAWSTGIPLPAIEVTIPGNYVLTVTDQNGCEGVDSIEVIGRDLPTPEIVGTPIFCPGDSAQLTTSLNYVAYEWSTGVDLDNIFVRQAGTFRLTVTDEFGCQGETEFIINQHNQPQPNIIGPDEFCIEDTITLTVDQNYDRFFWSTGSNEQFITTEVEGIFSVIVVDSNACRGFDTLTVVRNDLPEPEIVGRDEICSYETEVLGLSETYRSYTWQDGSTEATLQVNETNQYIVTVIDDNNCVGIDSFNLTVNQAPEPSIVGEETFCQGDSVLMFTTVPYETYSWNTGATTDTITTLIGGVFELTVTDENNCLGEASWSVIQFSIPDPQFEGPDEFCTQDTITLGLNRNFEIISWNTGADTRDILVDEGGTYSVTVTDIRGCSNNIEIQITENALPEVEINGPDTICSDDQATFVATPGLSAYLWQDGTTEMELLTNVAGLYAVTATDVNGCENTDTLNLVVNPIPVVTIDGDASFCLGDSIFLDAGQVNYTNYLWNTGDTTQVIRIGDGGLFTVTVTDVNGCMGVGTLEVERKDAPIPILLGDTTFCDGDSVTISVQQTFLSYNWSNGQTGPSITIEDSGFFTVRVNDGSECEGIGRINVTEFLNPEPVITGDSIICDYEIANLEGPANLAIYNWSNGENTPTISTNIAGNYGLTVTDENGCIGNTETTVIVNQAPSPQIISPTNFCEGDDLSLSVDQSFSAYLWSTGEISDTILITTGETYKVTVTDANGCVGEDDQSITQIPQPRPQIIGPSEFCEGGTVELQTAQPYNTFIWSTGSQEPQIEVTTGGIYEVTVTDDTGCDGTVSFNLTENLNPTPSINGDPSICVGQTTTFTAERGFVTYSWLNENNNTPILITGDAGTYTLEVTDTNGCQGNASVDLVINALPEPAILGENEFCAQDTTVLRADTIYSLYQWSNGLTTPAIGVFKADVYSLTVTDSNGCVGTSEPIEIIQNERPAPEIQGTDAICEGERGGLITAEQHTTYAWSTGQITSATTVNAGGVYSVTVTNNKGCTGVDSFEVIQNLNPIPNIQGPSEICSDQNTSLSLNNTYTLYNWSTGATSPSTLVMNQGNYQVTVTDANGCSGIDSFELVVNPIPIPEIAGGIGFCNSDTLVLTVVQNYDQYSWSNGSMTQMVALTEPGDYGLTVTDINGCIGDTLLSILPDVVPSPGVSGDFDFCEGSSTTISASDNFERYSWSTGETTSSIDINTPGTYTVSVVDENGCEGEEAIQIIENRNPRPDFDGDRMFCFNESTLISIDEEYIEYRWSNGLEDREVTLDEAGTYIVTVVDNNGCIGQSQITVDTWDLPEPVIDGVTDFCEGDTAIIQSSEPFMNYEWGDGSTDRTFPVTIGGVYALTVTDVNGCRGDTTKLLIQNSKPRPTVMGLDSFCAGSRSLLEAERGFIAYQWSSGQNVRQITATQSGTYTVTVTNARGCQGTASKDVIVWDNPIPNIIGDTSICEGEVTELQVEQPFIAYFWDNNETTPSITIDRSRRVAVTVFDERGCSGAASVQVNQFENPDPQIASAEIFCIGDSIILAVEDYAAYAWSNGDTESFTRIGAPGIYAVTVTNEFGCSATTATQIDAFEEPRLEVEGDELFCENGFTTLSASSGFESYEWSNGVNTERIIVTIPGTYQLTITDANGCQKTVEREIIEIPLPQPEILGPDILCSNEEATLSLTQAYAFYDWTNPRGETPEVMINSGGTYRVRVIDAFGCQGTDEIVIAELEAPSPSILGPTDFCPGDSILLSLDQPYVSYNWSDGFNGPERFVNREGAFAVVVEGDNGCRALASTVITAQEIPEYEVVGSQSFCEGERTTLRIIDTVGYDYQWSTGATNPQISIRDEGTYFLTVTNDVGCQKVDTFFIDELTVLEPILPAFDTICTGDSILLNAGNNYQGYEWNDGSTNAFLLVDSGGFYEVTLTDFNGCQEVVGTQVREFVPNEPIILGPGTLCSGQSTPLFVQGGFVDFNWSTGDTAQTISARRGGVYEITVTDANGCVREAQKIVNEIPSPSLVLQGDTTFCTGDSITLVADTDAGIVEWSNGAFSRSITVTEPGRYAVLVRSSNGCNVSTETFVEEKAIPRPVIQGDAEICIDEQATLDAGPGYISYNWSNGASSQQIDVSVGGNYAVEVVDTFGCIGNATLNLTVNPLPDVNILGKSSICPQEQVTLSANQSFDQYAWSNGSDSMSAVFDVPGAVLLTVTDTNQCQNTAVVDLRPGQIPIIQLTGNPLFCEGSSTIMGVRDTFITYDWSTGQGGRSIQIFEAGDYSVSVTNEDGCANSRTFPVEEAEIPMVNAGADIIKDCNSPTVQLDGSGSAQGDEFVYEWRGPGITEENRNQLNPNVSRGGRYALIVTNTITGCNSSPDEVEVIVENEPPVGQAISNGILTCDTDSVPLIFSPVSNPANLEVVWRDPAGLTISPDANGGYFATRAGDYILTFTDTTTGCISQQIVNVNQNTDAPLADAGPDAFLDCSTSTVRLNGNNSDNGASFDISWEGPEGASIDEGNTINPLVNTAGMYHLTIRRLANGCISMDSVSVSIDTLTPTANAGPDGSIDCEQLVATLDGSGSNAFGEILYKWTSAEFPEFLSLQPQLGVTQPGTYILEIQDLQNSCTDQDTVIIEDGGALPQVSFSAQAPLCKGGNDGFIVVDSVSGNGGPYMYSFQSGPFTFQDTFPNLQAGSYLFITQDIEGCERFDTVVVAEGLEIAVRLGDDLEVRRGTQITIEPNYFGISSIEEIDSIDWTTTDYNGYTCLEDDCRKGIIVKPSETSSYHVMITDIRGCMAEDILNIIVDDSTYVYIPNVFSPNGDGVNDKFVFYGGPRVRQVKSFQVFGRWGGMLFERFDYGPRRVVEGWDGRFKGQYMDSGVYVYHIIVELDDGTEVSFKGDITLLQDNDN